MARKKAAARIEAARAPARVMFIEFFPDALRRNERSMLFPFLKGLAREKGLETAWLCFGARRCEMAPGSEDWKTSVGDPGGTAFALGEALVRFRPTHVVSSDELDAGLREVVASAISRPRFVVMPSSTQVYHGRPAEEGAEETVSCDPNARKHYARCAWYLEWLGLDDPARGGGYLIEEATPDYAAELADEAARSLKPLLSIASGVLCGNRRRLRDNPMFKGVLPRADVPGAPDGGHHGCSFCGSDRAPLTSSGADIPALVEKQFRGILETAGKDGRSKGFYEFFDIQAFWKFDEVFEAILRLKVPPAVFLFNPRVDDVLRAKERIERTLPALEKAGHEVRILSMGIENFSERESRRFNKGITVEHVDAFLALAKDWGRRFPKAFKPFRGGSDKIELGFILFTPWTTLADLRVNLEHAAARGFAEKGYWLYSTLNIRPDDPLCLLARKEGGILGRFSDKGQLFGLFKNEGDGAKVVRWRFRDAKAADFFAVIVRVCAAEREGNSSVFFAGDALFEAARRLYARANETAAVPPLAIAFELLALLEGPKPPRGREKLLEESIRRAAAKAAPAVAPPPAKADAPAEPPAPHPFGERERAALDKARALLGAGSAPALKGVVIEAAGAYAPGSRSILLDLRVDGRPLSLALHPRDHAGPVFLEAGPFKIVYLKKDEEWGGSELGAATERLRLLAGLLERLLGS